MSRYKSRVSGFEKAPRCSTAFPAMICFTATSTFLPLRVYCREGQSKQAKGAAEPQGGKEPSAPSSRHVQTAGRTTKLQTKLQAEPPPPGTGHTAALGEGAFHYGEHVALGPPHLGGCGLIP